MTESEDKCSICQENLWEKDVGQLECRHLFHKECLEPLLKIEDPRCPICRKEFDESEITNIKNKSKALSIEKPHLSESVLNYFKSSANIYNKKDEYIEYVLALLKGKRKINEQNIKKIGNIWNNAHPNSKKGGKRRKRTIKHRKQKRHTYKK
jgi:hypothetical protein